MPSVEEVSVKGLELDLNNYRVTKQKSEKAEINALILAKPAKFWALMNSLLDDGYHPTENIIILKEGSKKIVREGNRRIASLKIILGYTNIKLSELPSDIIEKINNLASEWTQANKKVPCVVYDASEASVVEKVVALIHAKGESAGRDIWNAVARARHDRNEKGLPEPGLDLLEKFLKKSTLISKDQQIRWGGDYPLTVLNETISKMSSLLGLDSSEQVASSYPNINFKIKVDPIVLSIGLQDIGFKDIRTPNYFYKALGIPVPKDKEAASTPDPDSNKTGTKAKPKQTKPTSYANTDPRSVKAKFKIFKPMGPNREKLVALLNEVKRLDVGKHPHAFCFLLRSMFEISAKIYAGENSISTKKNNGNDKILAALLGDIINNLTNNNSDKEMLKILHGPKTELGKPDGLLSVTSLNQLVHNPKFSIAPSDICRLFGNVFPLLEEMNK